MTDATNTDATLDATADEGTTDEATTDESPQSFEDRVKGITDGSRLAEEVSKDALSALMDSARDAAKSVVTETRRALNATRKWARQDVAMRAAIILPTGFPDWGAVSQMYDEIVAATYSDLRATMDSREWGNLQSAKRMAIKRGLLEVGIRAFVAREQGATGDDDEIAAWIEATEKDPTKVGAFKSRVKEHYRNTLTQDGKPLAIPEAYLSAEEIERAKDGRGERDPQSALASGKTGVRGLKYVIPRFAVMVLLFGISELVGRIAAKDAGAIEDRAHVGAALDRIADIAAYGSAVADTNVPQDERDARKEAYVAAAWTTADDEYK